MVVPNNFVHQQPHSDEDKMKVAADAMGGKQSGRPPVGGSALPHMHGHKFHRLEVSAAENGYSVEHTTEKEPDSDAAKNTGDPYNNRKTTKHVFTHDHPASAAIRSVIGHVGGIGNPESSGQGVQSSNPLAGATHPSGPQNR